jgi:hypothetical protein
MFCALRGFFAMLFSLSRKTETGQGRGEDNA